MGVRAASCGWQDLGNIIAYITANRGGASGSTRDVPAPAAPALGGDSSGSASESGRESDPGSAEELSDGAAGSSGGDQGGAVGGRRRGGGPVPLQTFVFSATLTLPENLRRRLRKGILPSPSRPHFAPIQAQRQHGLHASREESPKEDWEACHLAGDWSPDRAASSRPLVLLR